MLAWTVVVAVHAALWWLASKALMPPRANAAGDDDPVLVWLSRPAAPPETAPRPPLPHAPARSAARAPARPPGERAAESVAESVAEPTADSALTAVDIASVAAQPGMPAAAAPAARTPWDAPPPAARPFASRAPTLPGQGVQRFRMQPPRSVASTVEQIGRMFGGGGPSDCEETRKNIRDLAVLGAEAVEQELDEERRNCRN